MKIDAIIGTFGNNLWQEKGKSLKLELEKLDGVNEVFHIHEQTLARARNTGASLSEADCLVFVDADDGVNDGYFLSMKNTAEKLNHRSFICKPLTLGVYEDGSTDDEPCLIPNRNLFTSNSLVIGSMVKREDFLSVGGFKELPILEDWELFLNLVCNREAKIKISYNSIYRVGVREGSRNSDQRTHGYIYSQITNNYRSYIGKIDRFYLD